MTGGSPVPLIAYIRLDAIMVDLLRVAHAAVLSSGGLFYDLEISSSTVKGAVSYTTPSALRNSYRLLCSMNSCKESRSIRTARPTRAALIFRALMSCQSVVLERLEYASACL